MAKDVRVRAATHADGEAIQRVAHIAWRATYAGHIPDEDIEAFLASAYSEQRIVSTIERLGDGYLVAERGDELVGYAVAGENRDGGPELFALYVLPSAHGVGVGFALWNRASDTLARRGHQRMCCWVLAANAVARRFYERQGAILTEERDFTVDASLVRESRYCVQIGSDTRTGGL